MLYPIWFIPIIKSLLYLLISSPFLAPLSLVTLQQTHQLLALHLHWIGRTEIFFCSNCGFELQVILYVVLNFHVLDSFLSGIFGHSPTILGFLFCLCGFARFWGSKRLIRALISKTKSGKSPYSYISQEDICNLFLCLIFFFLVNLFSFRVL